jgi:hypothetical protein
MAIRPVAASQDEKPEWGLFGSPDLDLGRHLTDPVGPERKAKLQELVLHSNDKFDFEAHTIATRTPSDLVAPQGTRPMLASPPSYRTPPKLIISRPPLSSPPSYRAPPIPSAQDPLLVSPLAFQIPPQNLRSESASQSINLANYSLFPQHLASIPATELNSRGTIENTSVVPPAPLFSKGHKRNTSDMSSATVQIGMRMSTVAVELGVEEHFGRSVTYPPITDRSKPRRLRDPLQLNRRSRERGRKPPGPPIEIAMPAHESSPHEILFRLNSNEELSPEAAQILPLTWPKPLEDLVSPTRRISSYRQFRDERMKSLPPVPATPSIVQPTSSYRASFPEPRTPASPNGPLRASQERTALSLALKEDEQWPLHGVSMVLLPDKSYMPDENRSWI